MINVLADSIRKHVDHAGGWMPFNVFMRDALYAPGHGYYESAEVFGKPGDFITGPDMGPWLALALTDLICWGWKQMGSPARWSLIEQGGGSGRLICEVISLLSRTGCIFPETVIAVEASEHMRRRQCAWYRHAGVDVLQTSSLSELERQENVLYFCNELPDAFPVRCFTWRRQTLLERGVCRDGEGFAWDERPLHDPPAIDPAYLQAWPDGYHSEWNPNLVSWQSDVALCMQRGYAFCVDYGYAASEYYRPGRGEGTLLAHLRHRVVDDVLADPGGRDITAHVDFTALGNGGKQSGLEMGCWMSQGAWLAQSPSVRKYIQKLAASADAESIRSISGVKRMLMPYGMGELFKLSIQSCNLPAAVPSFLSQFNRVHALNLETSPDTGH